MNDEKKLAFDNNNHSEGLSVSNEKNALTINLQSFSKWYHKYKSGKEVPAY